MATPTTTSKVSRLSCEGYADSIFIWTECNGNHLSLKASDGKNTWQGTLGQEQLEELAGESRMPIVEYLQETVKALSHDNMGDPAFVYSAEHSESSGVLHLTWKKQLSGGVKFQLGSMDLDPCDSQATNCFLLNYCVDRMQDLFRKVEKLDGECDRLITERGDALEMLQKCAALKDETEKDLYGKFKLILNGKKSKIRKLIDSKDHLADQNEEMRRSLWNSKSNMQPTKSESTSKDPSENYHHQTDVPVVVRPALSAAKPGTSVKSLLCDDAGSCRPPSPPPIKKPRLTKLSEKDKLVIPHPPHLSSPCSKAKFDKSGVRKKDSEMSVDADELLNMI